MQKPYMGIMAEDKLYHSCAVLGFDGAEVAMVFFYKLDRERESGNEGFSTLFSFECAMSGWIRKREKIEVL